MHPSPSTHKGIAGFMDPSPDATSTAQTSRGMRKDSDAGGTLAT